MSDVVEGVWLVWLNGDALCGESTTGGAKGSVILPAILAAGLRTKLNDHAHLERLAALATMYRDFLDLTAKRGIVPTVWERAWIKSYDAEVKHLAQEQG